MSRLRDCLGRLPARLRAVLVLRTGVGRASALAPAAAARSLHVSPARVVRMQRRALARLVRVGRAGGCDNGPRGPAADPSSSGFAFALGRPPSAFDPLTSQEPDAGGSAASHARAASSSRHGRSQSARHSHTRQRALLAGLPMPARHELLLGGLMALVALVLYGLLFGRRPELVRRLASARKRALR